MMAAALLIRLIFWLWFGAAIFVGHSHALQRLPPPALQGIIVFLTALLLLAYVRIPPLRAWVDAQPLRSLVLLHLTRFVGIYFLLLFQRGLLPREFAVPAGVGDIVIATMVLPVVFAPLVPASRRRAIVIWNVVGAIDMLLVLASAARLNLSSPGALGAFTSLPLSLLPTFLVPLILATHVIIFIRAARDPALG